MKESFSNSNFKSIKYCHKTLKSERKHLNFMIFFYVVCLSKSNDVVVSLVWNYSVNCKVLNLNKITTQPSTLINTYTEIERDFIIFWKFFFLFSTKMFKYFYIYFKIVHDLKVCLFTHVDETGIVRRFFSLNRVQSQIF